MNGHEGSVALPWADLCQLREALVTAVISVPEKDVVEINKAITLADLHLEVDSGMTRNGQTLEDVRDPGTCLTFGTRRPPLHIRPDAS